MISGVAMFVGFAIALFLYEQVVSFLYTPLLQLASSTDEAVLYVNSIAEGFVVRLKLSALVGFILSMPVHLYNILHFVFPGLRKNEKRVISLALLGSFVLAVGSFFYSYYTILPVAIAFLTGQGFIPENTGILLSFSGNIYYILQFTLMAIVVFQLPVVLEALLILNVVERKRLLGLGKYLIVLFFLISAIITPPDFVTQIALALPMTVLFYLTILIAKIFGFGEK
jgi:sec-independent protein translocase protein TatC